MVVFCFAFYFITILTYSHSIFAYVLIDSGTDGSLFTMDAQFLYYLFCNSIILRVVLFLLWPMTSGEREFHFHVWFLFLCRKPWACQMYKMMVSILKLPCIKRKRKKNRVWVKLCVPVLFSLILVLCLFSWVYWKMLIINEYIVYIHGQSNWNGSTKWKINEIRIHVLYFQFNSMQHNIIFNKQSRLCMWCQCLKCTPKWKIMCFLCCPFHSKNNLFCARILTKRMQKERTKKTNYCEKIEEQATRNWWLGTGEHSFFPFVCHYDMFAIKMNECLLLTFIIYLLTFQLKRKPGFGVCFLFYMFSASIRKKCDARRV